MKTYEEKNRKANKKLIATVAGILVAVTVIGSVAFAASKNKNEVPENTEEIITEKVTLPEIEIITEETTKKDAPQAEEAYEAVLEKYRKAAEEMKSGIIPDVMTDKLVNYEPLIDDDVKYAYVDINGDSVNEMVVASDSTIMNVWKLVDGEAKPVFEGEAFGRRAFIELCEDGVIKAGGYSGHYSVTQFCRLENAESDPVLIEGIGTFGQSENRRFVLFGDEIEYDEAEISAEKFVTEEEYNAVSDKYKPLTNFEWNNL